jgi:pimeloyl-ACP methyl ester carboxylesterase
MVMLDQRGTGKDALSCPALQRAVGGSDLTVPPAAAVDDCARRLGADRRFYTTTQTVADLDRLRRSLGIRRWWILGTSYGSYVAERYALAHPDAVAGLVLLSVVPQTGVDATLRDNLQAAGRVLVATCKRQRCAGDPAKDLLAALQRGVDGPQLLDALTALSVGAPSFAGVPAALHAAAGGDRKPLNRLMAAAVAAQAAPASALSQGLHAATLCADSVFPWKVGGQVSGRAAAIARARAGLGDVEVRPFDSATAVGNGIMATCRRWPPTGPPPPKLDRPLPDVPTLLVEGAADLSTNVAWMAEQSGHSRHPTTVVLPGVGHRVLRSPAGIRAIRTFLAKHMRASGDGPHP